MYADVRAYFQVTPSFTILSSSQGVSRRSLDQIIDPEPELSWIESMATPPSDTSEKAPAIFESAGIIPVVALYICDFLRSLPNLLLCHELFGKRAAPVTAIL